MRHVTVLSAVVLWSAHIAGAAPNDSGKFQALWTHVAPHSAVVYWRMKDIADEATSYVEYGRTSKYGLKTPATSAPRWAHFHRLTGLEPGVKVHYRPVLVCRGKTMLGPAGTLTTLPAKGWISVPGKLAGPPYVLDKGGKYI